MKIAREDMRLVYFFDLSLEGPAVIPECLYRGSILKSGTGQKGKHGFPIEAFGNDEGNGDSDEFVIAWLWR